MVKLLKRSSGFTVLEAIITLGILLMLMAVGVWQVRDYQQKLIFNNSVQLFSSAIDQATRIATINHEAIDIYHFAHDHYLLLEGKNYHKKIQFAENIKLSEISDYRISPSGHIPPKTIYFSDGKNQQKLVIQMNWGKKIEAH